MSIGVRWSGSEDLDRQSDIVSAAVKRAISYSDALVGVSLLLDTQVTDSGIHYQD